MHKPELDQESQNLLRRIVERQAYRQLMAANIRGHGLKFVSELEEKVFLARDLEHSLRILEQVEKLYAAIGGTDLSMAVRNPMDRIPYPSSRLELAVCLSLCDSAERIAASGYQHSRSKDFAAIARSLLARDRTATQRGEKLFIEFCSEAGNRAGAQQMLNRWLSIALLALGRPGTQGDERAVALKLRTKRCGESVREFLDELKPFLAACQLHLPSTSTLGIELPADLVATKH